MAVLGYGAQGQAHALNLNDSGVDVRVGLRPESPRRRQARAAGLRVEAVADAVAGADIVMMLVPDAVQPGLYDSEVRSNLRPGAAVFFAHGYNVHFNRLNLRDDCDIAMVAPLGIGEQVRAQYVAGAGVPALVAVHIDASGRARSRALAYASAMGHGRVGVIETTFAEETETDLFAEQAVLCGGLTHLMTAAFETLVEAGYKPEIAYFCCLHEVKLMADLVYERGIAGTRESISATAEFGDYTRGPRIVNASVRKAMRGMLTDIQNGRFDEELQEEHASGEPIINMGRRDAREHLIEQVGSELRAIMKIGRGN